ncbi:nucleotidyl transferase AbiEii/AbiGii toxin family protein [Desulfobacterales bacterium HSG2]|nr:nucleotidyl transferase AbiEii/AbiGii toxin family protein [Desulfobacterales bacterium HSG2]
MSLYEKFYRERLYPFQDGVLNIVKKLNIPFYLTGGTALGRGYFHHRYSDDLDLFVNQDQNYSLYVRQIFAAFEAARSDDGLQIDYDRLQKYENYTRFFLIKKCEDDTIELKIELVNDIACHYGKFVHDPVLGVLDSWRNILSNKMSAIFRYEAKDIVDIWVISKHKQFTWREIIRETKTKEAGTDPIVFFNILKSFPEDLLLTIKWVSPIDIETFKKELGQIAEDILGGTDNRLHQE